MRRTESPQALPHEVRVAPFVWDAQEDGPIPTGTYWLKGEVPAGSIVYGGFLQVTKTCDFQVSFELEGQAVLTLNASTAPGYYPLTMGQAADPTKNFLVSTHAGSRCLVTNSGSPLQAGQFCLYVLYLSNELGAYGQIENPDTPPLSLWSLPAPQPESEPQPPRHRWSPFAEHEVVDG